MDPLDHAKHLAHPQPLEQPPARRSGRVSTAGAAARPIIRGAGESQEELLEDVPSEACNTACGALERCELCGEWCQGLCVVLPVERFRSGRPR